MKNNLLKRWNSIAEIVRELGFNSGNISRCCSHDLKQAYGYKWEYELIEPNHSPDVGKMAEPIDNAKIEELIDLHATIILKQLSEISNNQLKIIEQNDKILVNQDRILTRLGSD
jgi:hypothetical protein